MTIQQIYYVIQIAEMGSMNKVAEKLYISQPTLTNAIKELEDEMNIRIFDRTNRGVILTNEGREFLNDVKKIYTVYENVEDKYSGKPLKRKFGISTQHYSFVIKAFVDLIKNYSTQEYELSIRETRTHDIIDDVSTGKSAIGILHISEYNKRIMKKEFLKHEVEFHPITTCNAYVYLYKDHPLAHKKEISFNDLLYFPCISFEQGDTDSSYFAEEILSDKEYPHMIKVSDRATALNLMVGLDGYTLCSGVINEELNGTDYKVIPFKEDLQNKNQSMIIGYILRDGLKLEGIGKEFINQLRSYFDTEVV